MLLKDLPALPAVTNKTGAGFPSDTHPNSGEAENVLQARRLLSAPVLSAFRPKPMNLAPCITVLFGNYMLANNAMHCKLEKCSNPFAIRQLPQCRRRASTCTQKREQFWFVEACRGLKPYGADVLLRRLLCYKMQATTKQA